MSNNNLINLEDAVLDYVLTKLNIKAESDLILADIIQDLSTIKDLNEFRIYIKENQRKSEFDYLTGVQKFDAMFLKFKEKEKIVKEDKITKKCNEIIEKLRRIVNIIESKTNSIVAVNKAFETVSYETIKIKNEYFFSIQDQKLLNKVGNIEYCLRNYDSLFNKLFNAYTSLSNTYLLQKKDSFIALSDLKKRAFIV